MSYLLAFVKLLDKHCKSVSKCQNFAISTFARVKDMGSGLLLMMILVLGPKVHLITERLKQKNVRSNSHVVVGESKTFSNELSSH